MARVGPRSAPPCFFDPPTMVGAMSFAFAAHAAAPAHPLLAIRSSNVSPTVGVSPGAAPATRSRRSRLAASRPARTAAEAAERRSRRRAVAASRRRSQAQRADQHVLPVRGEPGSDSPRTFSSSSARGRMMPHSSIAQANRSRSSVAPSCLPAMVNGGQGTPPASRSTPAYAAGSQTSRRRHPLRDLPVRPVVPERRAARSGPAPPPARARIPRSRARATARPPRRRCPPPGSCGNITSLTAGRRTRRRPAQIMPEDRDSVVDLARSGNEEAAVSRTGCGGGGRTGGGRWRSCRRRWRSRRRRRTGAAAP